MKRAGPHEWPAVHAARSCSLQRGGRGPIASPEQEGGRIGALRRGQGFKQVQGWRRARARLPQNPGLARPQDPHPPGTPQWSWRHGSPRRSPKTQGRPILSGSVRV